MEKLNLVDLMFRHKAGTEISSMSNKIGTIVKDAPMECFSPARPAGARKQIKVSGASTLPDGLFYKKDARLYWPQEDGAPVYGEFELKDGVRHFLVSRGAATFEEDGELPCRYHKLYVFLAGFLNAAEGSPDPGDSLYLHLNKIRSAAETGKTNEAACLAFEDEFYYGGKGVFQEMTVNTGDKGVIEQAKAGFRSGLYSESNRIGLTPSAFETEAGPKKTDAPEAAAPTGGGKDALWEDIKSGKYVIGHEWSEEQKSCIIPLSFLDDYVPDKNFYGAFNMFKAKISHALDAMKKGDFEPKKKGTINLFLLGRPGTGKTYMLHALSAAFGFPVRSVAMSKNTEEDAFEGMSKVIDGKLTEVETPFLKNAKQGGITIVEEINLADPDVVMGAIGQFVEYPHTVFEQGYMPVKRHPLNIICGTMNIGTAGSKEISEALSSRFNIAYTLDDPSSDDFISRLMVGGYKKKACEYVYDAYRRIIDALKSTEYNLEEYTLAVTFRSCLGALECAEIGEDMKSAISHSMVSKIAEKDLEIADKIMNEVIDPMPDFKDAVI